MNMKSTVVAASLLSMLSFGAFAATSVNAEQAQNLQPMGTVSVSQIGSAPMDMHQMLNEKAEAKGASSYRIVEARSGDAWHATAELYK
ncbi:MULTISPECIES: peroxide/acid stress response protein YhcN [Buttiauxella]|uniref:Putative exported protein n=1 Tax=Buttiauxella noackiae ATCC 51607 TaxID=1354255 RepID=A0A1B7HKN6_9ENTR|nr:MULTISPECIES: peroxide/acid stress response protein YhcN [Buttiauxella]MRT12281.1 peroxide/acid stress response protein YhcN [Enterobacteriaceae bacterium RIT711]MCA1921469.1 peroxide/acid stress response protein YhcN [Buttiauxella noackiae]MCE0800828.1 peroxide/acid stress response protein YhcN [Buttiauxella sp. W03-F01]MCE0812091.1 peroxide/acid stress response protein YhcN [Buttiauxella sp. S04-F03]MCE0847823.1 peroxide/acid stress response protein YhcN [Buttiauxella sp. A2-C1_F]